MKFEFFQRKFLGLLRRNGAESSESERFLNKNCAAHGRSTNKKRRIECDWIRAQQVNRMKSVRESFHSRVLRIKMLNHKKWRSTSSSSGWNCSSFFLSVCVHFPKSNVLLRTLLASDWKCGESSSSVRVSSTDQVNLISISDWMKLSISSFPDEQKRVDFMALGFSFGAIRDQLKVKNRHFLFPPSEPQCPRRFSGSKRFRPQITSRRNFKLILKRIIQLRPMSNRVVSINFSRV